MLDDYKQVWERNANRERRERIATAVLAGLAAAGWDKAKPGFAAEWAVLWADRLITELDK